MMVNLIRPSSVVLLTIAAVITKCEAFAFTSRSTINNAETPIDCANVRSRCHYCRPTSRSSRLYGKWDDLVDEGDIREENIPRDMRYIGFNILRQNKNFVDIRTASGGPPFTLTSDVYSRAPLTPTFFFVGKVARVSDVPLPLAVARQWDLIEEHAARLRPLELYKDRGDLELWCTAGDSEMDVAYNRPGAVFERMERVVEGSGDVRNVEVGFQGEIYDSGEEGFRTERTDEGLPLNPEIKPPEEKRAPTDDEMAKINQMFEGKDMNAILEEKAKSNGSP